MNKDRRNILKLAAIGGGLLAAGKFLDVVLSPKDPVLGTKEFENFKITESKKQISFADKSGDEILVIDKDGF